MNVVPLWNYIFVQQDEADLKHGSILLPDMRQKPKRGRVLAVGPGRVDDEGHVVPMSVKEGDHILIANHAGQEIDLGNGNKVLAINDNNVLARLE